MTNGDRLNRDPLDREHARDWLAAYALGALPADDARLLEALLDEWPEGRAELAELVATADTLAFTDEAERTPPLGLEGRIIAAARAERTGDGVVALRRRPSGPWWRRYAPHAFAAAFAVVALVFGVLALTDDDPSSGLWLNVDPAAEDFDPAGVAAYIVHPGPQPRAVFFAGLDPAPEGQTYALWLILESEDLVFVAPFDASTADDLPGVWVGSPDREAPVAGFGVTLEDRDADPTATALLFTFPAQ